MVISPKNRIDHYLNKNEIENILNGDWIGKDKTEEELVIKRIENYFHHFVMPIDFSKPNIYLPHWLPPIFPVGFQDSFDNSIGFFNLTYPILLNLPPLDFVWRFAAYPFRA